MIVEDGEGSYLNRESNVVRNVQQDNESPTKAEDNAKFMRMIKAGEKSATFEMKGMKIQLTKKDN